MLGLNQNKATDTDAVMLLRMMMMMIFFFLNFFNHSLLFVKQFSYLSDVSMCIGVGNCDTAFC